MTVLHIVHPIHSCYDALPRLDLMLSGVRDLYYKILQEHLDRFSFSFNAGKFEPEHQRLSTTIYGLWAMAMWTFTKFTSQVPMYRHSNSPAEPTPWSRLRLAWWPHNRNCRCLKRPSPQTCTPSRPWSHHNSFLMPRLCLIHPFHPRVEQGVGAIRGRISNLESRRVCMSGPYSTDLRFSNKLRKPDPYLPFPQSGPIFTAKRSVPDSSIQSSVRTPGIPCGDNRSIIIPSCSTSNVRNLKYV